MKLTVGKDLRQNGFALPTILLVSTVMLTILAASVGAVAASRVSLDSQYYNVLAKQAAQSGMARVKECLGASGNQPEWSTESLGKNLRPDSDCTGTTMSGEGVSAYVVGDGTGPSANVRTKYSVDAPVDVDTGSLLRIVGTVELVRSSSPNSVWRTYQQSLYYRINGPIAGAITCPSGFVPVPGNSLYGTDDFCLAKYESKNVGGLAVSEASGSPYIAIQSRAIEVAKNSCVGCHIMSEAEWMTVAQNALGVGSNWTGGSVGNGSLYKGQSLQEEVMGIAASTDDSDGYYGTGYSSPSVYRRTLTLSNGQTVWDLAGNAFEWTSGHTLGGQPGAVGYSLREWNSVGGTGSLSVNPFPSYGTPAASGWTSANGLGRIWSNTADSSYRGFARGIDYFGEGGLFSLGIIGQTTPFRSNEGIPVSFRLAIGPNGDELQTGCAPNFVVVPGNSLYGTDDFCVAKYETRESYGNPVVQPAGSIKSVPLYVPYGDDAQKSAADTCYKCRLITVNEWLTIAANVSQVPSNWTGGSVGSGRIYMGNAGMPAGSPVLDASTDDSDGYYGTGQSSGPRRRTLYLSNGEVIWDFVGNVSEQTTASYSGGYYPVSTRLYPNEPRAILIARRPGPIEFEWQQWGASSSRDAPFFSIPSAGGWGAAQGIGARYYNTGTYGTVAFQKGGDVSTGADYVGPFTSIDKPGGPTYFPSSAFRVVGPK